MSSTGGDTSTVIHSQPRAAYNDAVMRDRSHGAAASSLKRHASPEATEERKRRKTKKDDMDSCANSNANDQSLHTIDGDRLAEDLAQELQCACCSGLVYKPVVVVPCDHFFCGSCCTLWVKNGGTNCPACRSVSTVVMPSRALQSMVDVLLRAAPHRQRSERERMQADEIYPVCRSFRIPAPREPSPDPVIPTNTDFLQPCPHCSPNNPYRWACPRPVADPVNDPDNAWRSDSGTPPGHGFCGNCEVLLALRAPSTTRCDFCQVSFCGISVQERCVALDIPAQSPHGIADVLDLIQSPEIYDCFEGNTVEVELMLDYMTTQRLTPKQVYRQIAAHIQSQPEGFRPLIEQDLFMDMHAVPPGAESEANAPRRLICRLCAAEVFLYGLRDWWVRERHNAVRDGILEARKDCPEGGSCTRIEDPAHAKEFNHIIAHAPAPAERAQPVVTLPAEVSSSSHSAHPTHQDVTRLAGTSALFLPPISSDAPASSATLPSIPSLVNPRYQSMNDIFFPSGLGLSRRPEESQFLHLNPPSRVRNEFQSRNDASTRGRIAALQASSDDSGLAEPSSSQSQQAVEALLTQNIPTDPHGGAGSGQDGAGRDLVDIMSVGHLATRFMPEPAEQVEASFPSRRRPRSPLKTSMNDDASIGGADAIPASPYVSHILRDMGYETADANTTPTSSNHSVRVE